MLQQQWQTEWLLYEKVEFDGLNKLVIVHPDVTTLNIRSDVYSAWVRWVQRSPWAIQAMRVSGGDVIPGGETGLTFFMTNGWKLIYNPNTVAISGVLYSDDYATALWTEGGSPIYPATVSALVNSAVSTQNVVTGTVVTAAEIWAYVDRQLTVASGMSPAQEAKLNAIPTNPLLTTDIRLNHLDADISSGAGLSTIQNDKLLSLGTPTEIVTTLMNTPLPIAPTTNTFGDLIKNQIITLLRLKKFL